LISDSRLQDLILFVTMPGVFSFNEKLGHFNTVKNDMLPVDLLHLADSSTVVELYCSCLFLLSHTKLLCVEDLIDLIPVTTAVPFIRTKTSLVSVL